MNDENNVVAGPGNNGEEELSADLFLYHIGNIERLVRDRVLLNKLIQKARTQARADGVIMHLYEQARKISDIAPENNTENMKTLKEYLEHMGVSLGYQLTIEDVIASQDQAKGTAYKQGRAAGLKGYLAADNPYGDPASAEAQSWLNGLGDGGKTRDQIEKRSSEEDEQEAA